MERVVVREVGEVGGAMLPGDNGGVASVVGRWYPVDMAGGSWWRWTWAARLGGGGDEGMVEMEAAGLVAGSDGGGDGGGGVGAGVTGEEAREVVVTAGGGGGGEGGGEEVEGTLVDMAGVLVEVDLEAAGLVVEVMRRWRAWRRVKVMVEMGDGEGVKVEAGMEEGERRWRAWRRVKLVVEMVEAEGGGKRCWLQVLVEAHQPHAEVPFVVHSAHVVYALQKSEHVNPHTSTPPDFASSKLTSIRRLWVVIAVECYGALQRAARALVTGNGPLHHRFVGNPLFLRDVPAVLAALCLGVEVGAVVKVAEEGEGVVEKAAVGLMVMEVVMEMVMEVGYVLREHSTGEASQMSSKPERCALLLGQFQKEREHITAEASQMSSKPESTAEASQLSSKPEGCALLLGQLQKEHEHSTRKASQMSSKPEG
ncbi:hypothetical protein CYMTET_32724 [Cymbomonas tetramitiformis]|uniref:Uncharacterized protein n=1 Tax=Cymbomonas tetramitiformis TaxID=36881 RepID=A0AAE0FES0_9CHLO|nr:hypothetical protein CYMTET_32724 [Cymbomonas tetramitiformis]